MTPEEKAALRLLSKHGLSPPVSVRELASRYADIEEVEMPVRGDAIVVHHPDAHRRPLIILGRNRTSRERERFTLAHEIGHIKIPWHYGTISCSPTDGDVHFSGEYGATEAEANRFAAELLMPRTWLGDFIGEVGRIEDLFKGVVETAVVSHEAARIKLIGCLPPGYACIVERKPGSAPKIDYSPGTPFSLYVNDNDRADLTKVRRALDHHATDSCSIPGPQGTIRWWKLDCRRDVPDVTDQRRSSEILRDLLESLFDDRGTIFAREHRINGLVGSANQQCTSRDENALFGALKTRLSQSDVVTDEHLAEIVNLADFEVFLVIKAKELASGITKKRGPSSRVRRHKKRPSQSAGGSSHIES